MASVARDIPRDAPTFHRPARLPGTIVRHAFLVVVALAIGYPFFFMITSAFKDLLDATHTPPSVLPRAWHPENFAEAWSKAPWGQYFVNTVFVSLVVTVGELITSILAAYAFARMRFPGKGVVFTLFLATLMIPNEATLIPNFVLMSRRYLNLYDTYTVQILPFLATAFSIFLLRQFFAGIPAELSDAARIDGAGHMRFLWSIVLPLSVPALITVALITFLGSWNAFQWPLIVTNRPEIRPLQVGLAAFRQEAGSSYHLLMAASTFVIAPIVLLYLVAQRYLVQGIARTGIRG